MAWGLRRLLIAGVRGRVWAGLLVRLGLAFRVGRVGLIGLVSVVVVLAAIAGSTIGHVACMD